MDKLVRILLIEDNQEYRHVIEFALKLDPSMVVTAFGTAEMALRYLEDQAPEVAPNLILLDLNLPGMQGLEALPLLLNLVPSAKVMILSQSGLESDVVQAISKGALGYLLKSSTIHQIKEGIRVVLNGGSSLDSRVAKYIVNALKEFSTTEPDQELLTKREFQILELLAAGLQKKEISEQLHISYPTVDTHIRHIYDKMKVTNAPSAVNRAYKLGLFTVK